MGSSKLRWFQFRGEHYRWREWVGCGDPECGCGQERGQHPFWCFIGGADKDDALERLKRSDEDDGCTIINVELVGDPEGMMF